jgi:hypothetical protein
MPLLGGVPFHDGSSDQQTAAFISCDDRTLLTSGLARIGYSLGAGSTPDEIDSAGRIMFQGYIRYGRLYDEEGRRAVVSLGRDLRRGDVIHFTTLGQYGIVADDSPRSGWSYGGIPAGLPVIQALSSYPQIRPFYAALWSLRTLFGKSNLKILRYEAIPRPAFPKVKPKSARRPSVGKKPAPAIPKTPPKSGISQKCGQVASSSR